MKMRIIPYQQDREINFVRRQDNDIHLSKKYLEKYTGLYYSQHLDFYLRIELNDHNQLVMHRPTISEKILYPDGDRFLFEMNADGDSWYVEARFTSDRKGEIDGITMQHIRMMHHRFDKVKNSIKTRKR